MAVDDIMQVTLQETLHGQTCLQVCHYRVTAVGTGAAETAFHTAFNASVVPALKAVWSDELNYDGQIVQLIYPLPATLPVVSNLAAGAGTVAQSSLPSSMCNVLTKRTLYAGQKYRGRFYFPGVPVTYEDDSLLSAAAQTAWDTPRDALYADLSNSGYTFRPVLWHRSTQSYNDLVRIDIQPVLRCQRRRQVGRGI